MKFIKKPPKNQHIFLVGLQFAAFVPMLIYGFGSPALWLLLIFATILTLTVRFRNYYEIKEDCIFISPSKEVISYGDITGIEDIGGLAFKIDYMVRGEHCSRIFQSNMKDRLLEEIMRRWRD